MPKLKDIEFDLIPYKKENLMKLRLHLDNKNVESIWICVSDETKILLDKNTTGTYFIARLENDSLNLCPNRSHKLHILCRTNGEQRPECNLRWVDYTNKENRFWGI